MKLNKQPGKLVLAIWLILMGLIQLLQLSFAGMGLVLGILAIAAGLLMALRE